MVILVLFVLAALALVVVPVLRSDLRDARERERSAEAALRAEREREQVMRLGELHETLDDAYGYLAGRVLFAGELEALVGSGKPSEEILHFVLDRADGAEGIVLGVQEIGGEPAFVKLPPDLRQKHVYIIGRSGAGKTNLIRNMVLQDLENGEGFAVLAPEQELITEEILPFVPEHRLDDVLYLNPADTECPVSFNPLHVEDGEDLDLKADELIDIFSQVFSGLVGGAAPRLEAILQHGVHTLLRLPGSTLLDMERLLIPRESAYRERALSMIANEELKRFWRDRYETFPKDAHHSVLNRLDRLLRSEVMRAALCSPGRPFSFRQAMDEGKVLLINLSDGVLGAGNALLLGQIIVAKMQTAVMSRATVAKSSRRPYTLYMDEFQTFCGVASSSYERILSRARKYGLGVVLAHQQSGQIPDSLMREILGNVSTIVSFQVGARDAGRIAKEMIVNVRGVHEPERRPLDETVLQGLPVGSAWAKIDRSVFPFRTRRAPDKGSAAMRDEAIRLSREHFRRSQGVSDWNEKDHPRQTGSYDVEVSRETLRAERLKRIDPGEVF